MEESWISTRMPAQNSAFAPLTDASADSQLPSDLCSTFHKSEHIGRPKKPPSKDFYSTKADSEQEQDQETDQIDNESELARRYLNEGVELERMKMYDEAKKSYAWCIHTLLSCDAKNELLGHAYLYIGSVLEELNQYQSAAVSYKEAEKVFTQIEGDKSLKAVFCYNSLGSLSLETGQYEDALQYYKISQQIILEIAGTHIESVATSYSNVGTALFYLGKYDEALANHLKSLDLRLQEPDVDYRQRATSYIDLAVVYSGQGKYKVALDFLKKALEIRIELDGVDCPEVATCYMRIGDILLKEKMYSDALDCFQKALKIRLNFFSEDHQSIACCYSNIGLVLLELGKVGGFQHLGEPAESAEAFDYFLKAHDILVDRFGKYNPMIAKLYNNMGLAFSYSDDYEEAMNYFQRSLRLYSDIYNYKHIDMAACHENIAFLNAKEKNARNQAIYQYQECLKIREAHLPEDHPDLAKSYNSLGQFYFERNENEQAVFYFKKAEKIYLKRYEELDPRIAELYIKLGKALNNLQSAKKALEYLEKAKIIKTKLFGVSNASVKQLEEKINEIKKKQHKTKNICFDNKENIPINFNLRKKASGKVYEC